ncbi:MAG TPA: hypothetical protein PLS81_10980 [Deltaproteobacteria bacterium]|nr:hypothetical protein [Deltaproteobacteria bacterium]HPP79964.1 hypothetical protein [Deltaproteobacteria bacterium]
MGGKRHPRVSMTRPGDVVVLEAVCREETATVRDRGPAQGPMETGRG